MNKLRDALDQWDTDIGRVYRGEAIELFVEAARRVANLDYEAFHKALYEWYHSERPMSSDEEKKLINAALGITTEDE